MLNQPDIISHYFFGGRQLYPRALQYYKITYLLYADRLTDIVIIIHTCCIRLVTRPR